MIINFEFGRRNLHSSRDHNRRKGNRPVVGLDALIPIPASCEVTSIPPDLVRLESDWRATAPIAVIN
jgi:hypothetical protein